MSLPHHDFSGEDYSPSFVMALMAGVYADSGPHSLSDVTELACATLGFFPFSVLCPHAWQPLCPSTLGFYISHFGSETSLQTLCLFSSVWLMLESIFLSTLVFPLVYDGVSPVTFSKLIMRHLDILLRH